MSDDKDTHEITSARIVSRAQFCDEQIAAWTRRAESLRALARSANFDGPHEVFTDTVITALRSHFESVDDMIESLTSGADLCAMEAERWAARKRGAAS